MPGYRPPTSEPAGKWAKRIHEKRRADDLSRTEAFELLGARLGYSPKSLSAFRALDMGERLPNDKEAPILADWLGGFPADGPATNSEGDHRDGDALAALYDKLDAQAEAITLLANQVKALVEAQPDAADTAHLIAEAVAGALRVALPSVLRDIEPPRA